jgi:hypothetical protein
MAWQLDIDNLEFGILDTLVVQLQGLKVKLLPTQSVWRIVFPCRSVEIR